MITDQNLPGKYSIIDFAVENAAVKYGDVFRDGLLGDFYTTRNFAFKGNYVIEGNEKTVKNFNYVFKDSVIIDEINNLENNSYAFTRSDIPPEPFLSNFYEPVIAVGAAAVAVFLFFAIRSK